MTQHNYSVDKTAVLVALIPVVGFAGDRVKVAMSSDEVETVMGTDGSGRHVNLLDKSGTVTITLEYGSPSNAEFEVIRLAKIPVPILIKDNSNLLTMFATSDAVVKKHPDLILGSKPSECEWVFSFIKGDLTHSPAKEY